MTHASLFTSLGMFDYAAEKAGYKNIFQVENDEFCQKLLRVRYPETKKYGDIKQVDFKEYKGRINVISGGDPCQPHSIAGNRRGKGDDRYLWPEMFRCIQEVRPDWIINENVTGTITNLVFDQKISDLEAEGYDCQAFIIPALSVNAVHRRDRVWLIANNNRIRCNLRQSEGEGIHWGESARNEIRKYIGKDSSNSPSMGLPESQKTGKRKSIPDAERGNSQTTPDPERQRLERQITEGGTFADGCTTEFSQPWLEVATLLCRVDAPSSCRLLEPGNRKQRLKGLGNGIQWEIAYVFFQAIKELKLAL